MNYNVFPADVCVNTIIKAKYLNNSYVLNPNLIIADTSESHNINKRPLKDHSKKMKWDMNDYDLSDTYYNISNY